MTSPFLNRPLHLLLAVFTALLTLSPGALAAPTVTARVPAAGATVSTLSSIAVTFSEAVTGVDANDLLISNEAALTVAGTGAGPYTFTFTQPPPGALNVSWDFDHGIAGLGTGAYVQTIWSCTLTDALAPAIAKIRSSVAGQEQDAIVPPPGSTVGALSQVEVTFSEAVSGVNAADLLVGGVAATGVSGSGAGPYVFAFTQPAAGAVSFQWAAGHGITDTAAAPNAFAGGSWSVTLGNAGSLTINEFLAGNATGLADENAEQAAWIEIHNNGVGAVNLAGWALTDDADLPGKWVFPSRSVAQGAYLVVFASGKDRKPVSGNLHTNFKPKLNGGYLALVSPQSPRYAVAQFPANYDPLGNPPVTDYPAQRYDYSYGLQNPFTGGLQRYFFTPPTPGAVNGAATLTGAAAKPNVSVARGFFTDAFQLVVSCPTAGATVRYTLDGSVPIASGTAYTAPLTVSATTVLRLVAFSSNLIPSETVTHSYIFLDQVFSQTSPPYDNPANGSDNANPQPPSVGGVPLPVAWGIRAAGGLPGLMTNLTTNQVPADYGMDPEIFSDANKYDDTGAINPTTGKTNLDRIKQGLRDLPIMSVVLKSDDMWGAGGMYSNPTVKGPTYERACSVEMILPDGSTAFATTCGIRIHGNASRNPESQPKHGFNLNFKGDYGVSSLEYQLFPDSPAEKLDNIVLRADYNSSWLHWDGGTSLTGQRLRGTRLRDAFCKDTFRAMGRPAGHNRYVNLFINGIYWGSYDPAEKESDSFAALYYGGDKGDYDVYEQGLLKAGTATAYTAMTAIASPIDQPKYEQMKQYLDVPEFIDYMLFHFWTGHQDWGDDINKNWYAVRNAKTGGTFKYLPWDQENLMFDPAVDRTGVTLPASGLHPKLVTNTQYLLDFADRAHRHLLAPDGALQASASIARFNKWKAILTNGIAAESARWGDYRRDVHRYQVAGPDFPLYTWNGHWIAEVNRLTGTWFPTRNTNTASPTLGLLPQLRSRGLYPMQDAAELRDNATSALLGGQRVAAGFQVKMQFPAAVSRNISNVATTNTGTIYYTTDGSDPRVVYTGAVAATAAAYSVPITINATITIKARTLTGATWSALNEATLTVGYAPQPVRITEIMYRPTNGQGGDSAEFVELQNTSGASVDMSGWFFDGIDFIFPNGFVLGAGDRLVLASNNAPATFATTYPGVVVAGYFAGTLDNGGERLALLDAAGKTLVSADYDDDAPWPTAPDGGGYSLEIIDANGDPDSPVNWKASNALKGTPGLANSAPPATGVLLHEVLAENAGVVAVGSGTDDYIELKNTGGSPVDVNGWTVASSTGSYTFTGSTVIGAGGFLVLPCSPGAGGAHLPAALPAGGGFVQLKMVGGAQVDAVPYGVQLPNLAIGRVAGAWVLTVPTVGAENTAASVASAAGNLAINEWLSNPVPGGTDWIEIYNNHATLPLALTGLYFQTDTQLYRYPALSFLAPHGYLQLFADGQAGANQLDFKLPATGTALAILDAAGTPIDTISAANFGTPAQGVSRGRVPDGTATLATFTASVSPGAANYLNTWTGPVLNEVVARNATGAQADWVEFTNPTGSTFDLSGMKLGTTSDAAGAWIFPAGSTVPANGQLALWCDPGQAASASNTALTLGDASGGLWLFNAGGQLVNQVAWGFQIADKSIGLHGGVWKILAAPTRGLPNSAAHTLGAVTGLRINEWMAQPAAGADWFEIYNPDANPVAMAGLYLTDDPSELGRAKFVIPALSFIGGQGWVKWEADSAPEAGRNHVNFTLDGGAEYLRLSNGDTAFTVIDAVSFGAQAAGVSQGRILDGAASIVAMPGSPTPGAKNVLLPAPSFSTHPISQTVMTGANPSFLVAASGSAPLTLQWKFNGADIPGATAATLALTGVTAANDGIYTSIATNSAGTVSSNAATLLVQYTYAQWAVLKGLGGANAVTTADPDGDGVRNLQEFFHNLNPQLAADFSALPQPAIEPPTGTPLFLTLTYRRSARAVLTGQEHQLSLTLAGGSWGTVAPDVTENLSPDPVTGDPRVRVKFSIAPGETAKFLHLLLTP